MNYKKINKNTAEKLYNEGKTILVKPFKMPIEAGMWFTPMYLNKMESVSLEPQQDKLLLEQKYPKVNYRLEIWLYSVTHINPVQVIQGFI